MGPEPPTGAKTGPWRALGRAGSRARPCSVPGLGQVGFRVFRTGEKVSHGGGPGNLPDIQSETNPRLASDPGVIHTSTGWLPPSVPVVGQRSPAWTRPRTVGDFEPDGVRPLRVG